MGSLIKNGGGTIVTGGGYVAGRADLVERAVARLTAPGIGMDAGCVPGETLRLMFQGGRRSFLSAREGPPACPAAAETPRPSRMAQHNPA